MTEAETAIIAELKELNAATRKLIEALSGGATTQRTAQAPSGGNGATLPNYGRNKGQPVHGQAIPDLEYYAAGCRRTLDDPGKSRWHDKERDLLRAIEAEIARQSGGAAKADEYPDEPPF